MNTLFSFFARLALASGRAAVFLGSAVALSLFLPGLICLLWPVGAVAAEMPVLERLSPLTSNLEAPTAVALDRTGAIYVAESSNNRVLIYSPDGTYRKTLSGLARPVAVAVDAAGKIYVANVNRHNVEIYGTDLKLLSKLGAGDGEFAKPVGITIVAASDIYVVDSDAHAIRIYRPDGTRKASFGNQGSADGQFTYPTSITVNEVAQEIIVTDLQALVVMGQVFRGARVQVFDMGGGFKRSFGKHGQAKGELSIPQGVVVDAEGRVFVSDSYQNLVQVYDGNGLFLGTIFDSSHPFRTPLGMALSSTNRLFIASLNTRAVEIYGPHSAANLPELTGSIAAAPKQAKLGDTLNFAGAAKNVGNVDLTALPLTLAVTNSDTQAPVRSWDSTADIAQGASFPVTQNWPVDATLPPGNYNVTLNAKVGGKMQTLAQDTFAVMSTAITGAGLVGTVAALPKQAYAGDTVSLTGSTTNQGNADMTAVPLVMTIIDTATNTTIKQWNYSPALTRQNAFTFGESWSNAPMGNYVAKLSASVGGNTLALAQDGFAILKAPQNLKIGQNVLRETRLLVLVACDNSQNRGWTPECAAQRAGFIDAYLTGLGLAHKVVIDEASFVHELRCGCYNTYWMSGSADKLNAATAAELLEAVNRGNGFILDGEHDNRNHALDKLRGVDYQGKRNASSDNAVWLAGDGLPAGSFSIGGDASQVALNGGSALAYFGNASKIAPAIVTSRHGLGQTLLFAFDLIATLQAQGDSPLLAALVNRSLNYVMPVVPEAWSGGAYVPLITKIENQAQEQGDDLDVTISLPDGISIANTVPTPGSQTAAQTSWRFMLPAGETKTLQLAVRAATNSGKYAIQTQVNRIRNGVSTTYQLLVLDLNVAGADQIGAQVILNLQTLNLAGTKENKARNIALANLQQAASNASQGNSQSAIAGYLVALEQLGAIKSVSTASIQLQIDALLQQAQQQWCSSNSATQ